MGVQESLDTIVHELNLHRSSEVEVGQPPIKGFLSNPTTVSIQNGSLSIRLMQRDQEEHPSYGTIFHVEYSIPLQDSVVVTVRDLGLSPQPDDSLILVPVTNSERTIPLKSTELQPLRNLLDALAAELKVKDHEGLEYKASVHLQNCLDLRYPSCKRLAYTLIEDVSPVELPPYSVYSVCVNIALAVLGGYAMSRFSKRLRGKKKENRVLSLDEPLRERSVNRMPRLLDKIKGYFKLPSPKQVFRHAVKYAKIAALAGIMCISAPRAFHNILDFCAFQQDFSAAVHEDYQEAETLQDQLGFIPASKSQLIASYADERERLLYSLPWDNGPLYILTDLLFDGIMLFNDGYGRYSPNSCDPFNISSIDRTYFNDCSPEIIIHPTIPHLMSPNIRKTTVAHERAHHVFHSLAPYSYVRTDAETSLHEGAAVYVSYLTAQQSGNPQWIAIAGSRFILDEFLFGGDEEDKPFGFNRKKYYHGEQFVSAVVNARIHGPPAATITSLIKHAHPSRGEILCPELYIERTK